MNEPQSWNRSVRRAHFVCGLVVGGLIGLRIGWDWFDEGRWWAGVLAVAVSALIVGWLAHACLDEFWRRLVHWFR